MSKIKVKNTSGYQISIILNNVRYRRDLNPGQEAVMPEEVYEEFNFDNGCRNYVRSGFLKVISEDAAVQETFVQSPADVDVDVEAILTNGSPQELAKLLSSASVATKDKIVAAAIKYSITDAPRVALIKTHCQVDILQALALQRAII